VQCRPGSRCPWPRQGMGCPGTPQACCAQRCSTAADSAARPAIKRENNGNGNADMDDWCLANLGSSLGILQFSRLMRLCGKQVRLSSYLGNPGHHAVRRNRVTEEAKVLKESRQAMTAQRLPWRRAQGWVDALAIKETAFNAQS
jgi:hypothetical protein